MLIDNINEYDTVKLYECDNFREYLILLKNGVTPIYISKSCYYFLKDDKLTSILNKL